MLNCLLTFSATEKKPRIRVKILVEHFLVFWCPFFHSIFHQKLKNRRKKTLRELEVTKNKREILDFSVALARNVPLFQILCYSFNKILVIYMWKVWYGENASEAKKKCKRKTKQIWIASINVDDGVSVHVNLYQLNEWAFCSFAFVSYRTQSREQRWKLENEMHKHWFFFFFRFFM